MQTSDFLLERVIHHVLKGDPHPSLLPDAAALDPAHFIADILWPASECILQLHADGATTARVLNTASRALRSLLESAAQRLDRQPPNHRSAVIFTAPGESSDLGAHLLATLAESHGFRVFFAGANLSLEELAFSIGQLAPDTLLMHGALQSSAPRAADLLRQLRHIRVWPSTQLAVAGALASALSHPAADLLSPHPIELLELLSLWPDYRHTPDALPPLQMPPGATESLTISTDTIRQMIRHHFSKHPHHPN
ncbi:MAG: cobalamin B12-binding domain-containing protein [Phycisphaerae bacterium]